MLSSHSCHSEISLCSSVFCISKPPPEVSRAWFHAAEAAALLQQLAIAGGHLATHHAHGQWPRVLHADVEGVRRLTPHGAAGGGIDDCLDWGIPAWFHFGHSQGLMWLNWYLSGINWNHLESMINGCKDLDRCKSTPVDGLSWPKKLGWFQVSKMTGVSSRNTTQNRQPRVTNPQGNTHLDY